MKKKEANLFNYIEESLTLSLIYLKSRTSIILLNDD